MRIDHIALYCHNLEAMRNFFIRYFKAQSNAGYHNPRTNLRTFFLTFSEGSTRLEIMTRPELASSPQKRAYYATGFTHLAIAVGNRTEVDTISSRLNDDGYPCISGPRITGDGYYEAVVKGPEGIEIEITE